MRSILGGVLITLLSACADNNVSNTTPVNVKSKISFYVWHNINLYDDALKQMQGFDEPTIFLNGDDAFSTNAEILTRKGSNVWYMVSSSRKTPDNIDYHLNNIIEYNRNHKIKITGLIMDVEPWIDRHKFTPETNKKMWEKYLAYLKNSKKLLLENNLKLSVTIANWFDSIALREEYPTKGKPIYEEIIEIADEIVIMNYTTNFEQFYLRVKNELIYADDSNKQVTIALEITNVEESKVSFYNDIEQIRPFLSSKKVPAHKSFKEFALHDLDNFVILGLEL